MTNGDKTLLAERIVKHMNDFQDDKTGYGAGVKHGLQLALSALIDFPVEKEQPHGTLVCG